MCGNGEGIVRIFQNAVSGSLMRAMLGAIVGLSLIEFAGDTTWAQSAQPQSQQAQSSLGQPLQTQTQSTGRLPGVRLWRLEAVSPDEADRRLHARTAAPNLVSPKGFADGEMHLIKPAQ